LSAEHLLHDLFHPVRLVDRRKLPALVAYAAAT